MNSSIHPGEHAVPVPTLSPLARFQVTVSDVIDVGVTPAGHRRIALIDGGTVSGPRLAGRILPGGGDWQAEQADGTVSIDTRYVLQCDDGALIHVRTRGLRTGSRPTLDAVARGEDVDPADYYYRATGTLETAAPEYAWLNGIVAVFAVARLPESVLVDAYTVT